MPSRVPSLFFVFLPSWFFMTSFLCIIGTGTHTLMLFACLSQATSVCLLSFSSVRFFLPFCSGTRTRTHYGLPEPLMCVLLALLLRGRSSLSISYLDTHPPLRVSPSYSLPHGLPVYVLLFLLAFRHGLSPSTHHGMPSAVSAFLPCWVYPV